MLIGCIFFEILVSEGKFSDLESVETFFGPLGDDENVDPATAIWKINKDFLGDHRAHLLGRVFRDKGIWKAERVVNIFDAQCGSHERYKPITPQTPVVKFIQISNIRGENLPALVIL